MHILVGLFSTICLFHFEQELQKQLLMITEERNSLLSETQQMRLTANEAEVLKENCNKKASALFVTNHKLAH